MARTAAASGSGGVGALGKSAELRSRLSRETSKVRLHELAKVEGETVDLRSLKSAGVIPATAKRARVFASGTIERAVTVKGVKVTKGARAAIEAAGGTVE